MARFSQKERIVATILSATPGLKKIVKRIYVTINAIVYHKSHTSKIISPSCGPIICPLNNYESFFGYYDKSPEEHASGLVVAHITCMSTKKKPSAETSVDIVVCDICGKNLKKVGSSSSYNWQQGTRAHWIGDGLLMYNRFLDGKYEACLCSVRDGCEIRRFPMPVQDSFGSDFFLSVNYSRIMSLRPDYGYRNMQPMTKHQLIDLANDGIWKVDIRSGEVKMLHELSDIVAHERKPKFVECLHKVNHLMISPDGKKIIFIHRWYDNGRRYDRLLLSDFRSLKTLADNSMVSHMCWVDNDTLFGYFRNDEKDGFYFIDVSTGKIWECKPLTALQNGDGHPSSYKEWIVVDTYPDKSRMQHLYLYNRKNNEVHHLLEVYHGLGYNGETRCDLHPRFSSDGRRIFFDSVFKGQRRLCHIDVSKLIK